MLEERVAAALRSRGWRVRHPSGASPNLLATKGPRTYVIELKAGREPRREVLQAFLADSILRARRAAADIEGARPLAIVGAPRISNAMAAALKEYAEAVAPETAFGYADERGLVELFGKGLEGAAELPRTSHEHEATRPRARALFSDLNQWLLKVLLGQKISPDLMTVPRSPIGSPSELAKIGRVSIPSAWRLVSQLEVEGFLERGPGGLQIVRTSELLEKWRAASSSSPPQQFPMAWALPSGKSLDQIKAALRAVDDRSESPGPGACLGLFSGCEVLGLSFVGGGPTHVYLPQYDPVLVDRLGLRPAGQGRVDVHARVARWRESIFRGAVRRDGVWATDVLQCWLDVSAEPTRGEEQAEFLWQRVLAPQLRLEGSPR